MEDMNMHQDIYHTMETEYRRTLHDLHRAWRAGKLTSAQYNAAFNAMEVALLPGSIDKKTANIATVRATYLTEGE